MRCSWEWTGVSALHGFASYPSSSPQSCVAITEAQTKGVEDHMRCNRIPPETLRDNRVVFRIETCNRDSCHKASASVHRP